MFVFFMRDGNKKNEGLDPIRKGDACIYGNTWAMGFI